jgi:hypothetical protein
MYPDGLVHLQVEVEDEFVDELIHLHQELLVALDFCEPDIYLQQFLQQCPVFFCVARLELVFFFVESYFASPSVEYKRGKECCRGVAPASPKPPIHW